MRAERIFRMPLIGYFFMKEGEGDFMRNQSKLRPQVPKKALEKCCNQR